MHNLIFTLALVAFVITQPFTAAAESPEKGRDWYRENGVTVLNPPGSAPMSFVGFDGQPAGFVIDMWKKWSDETGIPVRFQFAPWQETLELVRTGACEIHGGLFFNSERDAFLDFSEPYIELPAALVVPKDNDADLDSIYANDTIGVVGKGFAEYFILKNHPNAKLRRYASGAAIVEGFIDGEVQALAGDHPILVYEFSKRDLSDKLMVKDILYTQSVHGATAKGNPDFIKLINTGFDAIDKEERRLIVNRWFVMEEDDSFTENIALIGVVFLAGVVALFYFDSLALRRRKR